MKWIRFAAWAPFWALASLAFFAALVLFEVAEFCGGPPDAPRAS